MYLRYKTRSEKGSNTQFEYQIDSVFDPFDKKAEYKQKTKETKELTQTSLLIKPKYGSAFTKETLTTELTGIIEYIKQTIVVQASNREDTETIFPEHTATINEKHILLQFKSKEDTTKAKSILEQYRGKFLQGSFTDVIL